MTVEGESLDRPAKAMPESSTASVEGGSRRRRSLIAEIGLTASTDGNELHGASPVVEQMLVPDTDILRMSVLVAWTDTLVGFAGIAAMSPQVPVTLDLSVELHRLPRDIHLVTATTRTLKAGSSVLTAEVGFLADGNPFGLGMAAFVTAPGASVTLPPVSQLLDRYSSGVTVLTEPYAERAGCERVSPGVASIELTSDKLNAGKTLNGGLIAVVIEEAALSAAPGRALTSMTLRYLRAARVGPFIATAHITGELARVEVRDRGSDDRIVIVATARLADIDS